MLRIRGEDWRAGTTIGEATQIGIGYAARTGMDLVFEFNESTFRVVPDDAHCPMVVAALFDFKLRGEALTPKMLTDRGWWL